MSEIITTLNGFRKTSQNLCLNCPIIAVSNCPIWDIAESKGLAGMEKCEVREAVDKLIIYLANSKGSDKILKRYKNLQETENE